MLFKNHALFLKAMLPLFMANESVGLVHEFRTGSDAPGSRGKEKRTQKNKKVCRASRSNLKDSWILKDDSIIKKDLK